MRARASLAVSGWIVAAFVAGFAAVQTARVSEAEDRAERASELAREAREAEGELAEARSELARVASLYDSVIEDNDRLRQTLDELFAAPEPTPEPSPAPPMAPSAHRALVTRVIDGDTIEVEYRGQELDVRLIGVDTPETVHPSEPIECFGPQASAFTERRLEGTRVRLEFDVERSDPYERTLAYVWVGQRLFNQALVARGFATVSIYPPNDAYEDRLDRAQRRARRLDAGLWEACSTRGDGGGRGGGAAAPPSGGSGCTPGYSPCLPPASDYDCAGGGGDGPEYTGRVTVTGSDPYALDSDADGTGCES